MTALRLERISKSFGGVAAVADFSMEIAPGRITGLIGPNGAGKSTVVNLIAGILGVNSGRVLLDGADISKESAHAIARRGVARTFQNIRLLREASVVENIVIGFHRHERTSLLTNILGLPSAWAEKSDFFHRADALLERFGLAAYRNKPAGALAYGHQRKVEMMRALAMAPSILLLDEPVAGMNDVEADELGTIFREVAAEGVGVLLIEHNVRFVREMCSTVYALNSGRLIAAGTPDEVCADTGVIEAYLGV